MENFYHHLTSECLECHVGFSAEISDENDVAVLGALFASLDDNISATLNGCTHSLIDHKDTYYEYRNCDRCGKRGILNVDLMALTTHKERYNPETEMNEFYNIVLIGHYCNPLGDKNSCFSQAEAELGVK